MRLPWWDAPPTLRHVLRGYVVVFAVGFVSLLARDPAVAAWAFIVAAPFGFAYGALLFSNFRGSADYMSARSRRRQENGIGFQSPATQDPRKARLFGLIGMIAFPAVFISVGLGLRH